jgi:diguanylate cyclase (GGDEF)-like protein
MAQRIMQKMKEPIELAGRRMVMTTSIGISLFPDDGTTCEELLKHADLALYQSKGAGATACIFQFEHEDPRQPRTATGRRTAPGFA